MNGRNDDNENHKRHLQGRVMTKWNECVSVSEGIALFMTILLRDDIFLCVFFSYYYVRANSPRVASRYF